MPQSGDNLPLAWQAKLREAGCGRSILKASSCISRFDPRMPEERSLLSRTVRKLGTMHPATGAKEIEKLLMVLIKNYARQRFGGALWVSEFVRDAFKCPLAFHDKQYRTASFKSRYARIFDLRTVDTSFASLAFC